jgi:hypothetical protein
MLCGNLVMLWRNFEKGVLKGWLNFLISDAAFMIWPFLITHDGAFAISYKP